MKQTAEEETYKREVLADAGHNINDVLTILLGQLPDSLLE